MTFVQEEDIVNHIDGNKHNNAADNLEWCTNAYNHEHATQTGLKAKGSQVGTSKLSESSVIAIRRILKDGINHGKIAEWFGVSRPAISMIPEGKTWAALTNEELTIKE